MVSTSILTNQRLVVEQGTAWVTQTGDPRDYIVTAGQGLNLIGSGWLVGPLLQGQLCRWHLEPLPGPVAPLRFSRPEPLVKEALTH